LTITIKSFISIIICLLLIFSMGCTKKNPAPDREANVNGGIFVETPEVSDDKSISANKVEETPISAYEAKKLWSYSHLNDKEKSVYRIMLTMVKNFTEGWVELGYLGNTATATVTKAFRALSNDYPEYYWMPSSYYLNHSFGKSSISFKKNSNADCYGYTAEQVVDDAEEWNDAILRIMEKVRKANTPFEKELVIHDELCKLVVYDGDFETGVESDIYSAFGALVYGRAVCEGYARAFKLLCKYADIQCILITGDSKGVGHMWNMVNIDENWYHVDVTWDDLRSEYLHTYFNVTELTIRADHDIDITYDYVEDNLISSGNSYNFNVPKTENEKYNYFLYNSLVVKDDIVEDIANFLTNDYNNGNFKSQFTFSDDANRKDFTENFEDYVVKIQERCIEKTNGIKFKLKTISFPSKTCVIYFEEYKKKNFFEFGE